MRSTVRRFGKLHRYEELARTRMERERERDTRTYTRAGERKDPSPLSVLGPLQRKRPLIGQAAREVYGT